MSVYNTITNRDIIIKIMALLFIAGFTDTFCGTMIIAHTPDIAEALEMDITYSSWIVILNYLGMVSLMFAIGKMAEYGKIRTVFVTCVGLFIISALCCAFSTNPFIFLISNFFLGVGVSGFMLTPAVLVVTLLPADMKGKGMGIITMAAGLALILGPTVGGLITDSLSWMWMYLILVPLGIVVMILGYFWIPKPDNKPTSTHFDYISAGLISVSIGCMLFFFQCLLSKDVSTWLKIVTLVVAIVGFTVLWRRERKKTHDWIINGTLLKNRHILMIMVAILLSSAMISGAQFILPYVLTYPLDLGSVGSGIMLSLAYLFTFASSYYVGTVCDRKGSKGPTIFGIVLRLIFCVASVFMLSDFGWIAFIPMVIVLGLSCGVAGTAQMTRIVHHSKKKDQADAAVLGMIMTNLGSSIGLIVYNLTLVLVVPGIDNTPIGDLDPALIMEGFNITGIVGAVICIAALALMMIVPNINPKENDTD